MPREGDKLAIKVNIRELKEYAGQLARLLLRLSHVPPEAWPENRLTPAEVQRRIEAGFHSFIRLPFVDRSTKIASRKVECFLLE